MFYSAKDMAEVSEYSRKNIKTLKVLRYNVDADIHNNAKLGFNYALVHTSLNRPQDVRRVQKELTKLGYKTILSKLNEDRGEKYYLEMRILWDNK